jgi:cholesterol oxidase
MDHFDAIVVGSGFGGSVTAARLAEADWKVCLLERGKRYPPNSFPRGPAAMKRNFWDPSEGLQGMFDVWSFDGLDAVCASGLGGGSLIYANVLLRKDERWFVKEDLAKGGHEDWPVTRADLEPHYEEVERRIGVEEFPLEHSPYDRTPKVLAYREAAKKQGLDWKLVPLAVTFANKGRDPVPGEPMEGSNQNLHGQWRSTCRLCGECDVGCNYGSKNTLDYNYLSAAARAGAELRTRCEVRAFEPSPQRGGYLVHYVRHEREAEDEPTDTSRLPRHTLHCDHLILSAGTMGTTWLMLRNRAALPALSSQLGVGFSGNGDLLTFALDCARRRPDGKRIPLEIDPARGPVITSAIRMADALDGGDNGDRRHGRDGRHDGEGGEGGEGEGGGSGGSGGSGREHDQRGFYLEDAGYPQFASWMLETLQGPEALLKAIPRLVRQAWQTRRGHRHSEIGALVSALFGATDLSSGVLPLLGMGRDIPDGHMTLNEGRLEVDWSKDGASAAYFDRLRATSQAIAKELGATFEDNPMWLEKRVITVHALGGCRMGNSPAEGVVDSMGRVFGHPGLHIADGSVMPGPVGANPSLTIAALADRFAGQILTEKKS